MESDVPVRYKSDKEDLRVKSSVARITLAGDLLTGESGHIGVWPSPVGRFVRDEEVVGSNPTIPTSIFHGG